MHVKKVAQLGNGSLRALSSGPAPEETGRAQPKGLKARYQPFGVHTPMGRIGGDDGADAEGDVDMTDAPTLAIPSGSAQAKTNKKDKKKKAQKGKDADTARKGKRKLSSEDEAAAAAEQLMEESQSAKSKSKKQKTQRNASPDLGSDEQSSSTTKKTTLVVPPNVPSSTPAASTPAASTPASKLKNKTTKAGTPVSAPRQSVVPIPVIPGSSQLPKVSPVPVPRPVLTSSPHVSRDTKKTKGKREKKVKAVVAATEQSPPPSAQGSKSNKGKVVTPVPAPKFQSIG